MKVKLKEFKSVMETAINETVTDKLSNILEDKDFTSICENIEIDNTDEKITDEILEECAAQFTSGVFEEMNITKDRVDEIAFLAPWIGKLAITALRPLITKMLAKFGVKFFASTAGKAILKKIGCRTAAQALKKLGVKTAGKAVAKKTGKSFGNKMLGKAAKWTGYTLAGNAIMGGGSKNDNVSSTYDPSGNYEYSYAAESIDRVFKRHFND